MNKQQAEYARRASKDLHECLRKMITTVRMHTELNDDEYMAIPFSIFKYTVERVLDTQYQELKDKLSWLMLELAKMEDCN